MYFMYLIIYIYISYVSHLYLIYLMYLMYIYVSYVSYVCVSFISQTTTARALKVCVLLWLELSNIFLKSSVWTTHGLEMFEVRKKANLTSIHGLISHELQQLGHSNFVCHFDLNLAAFLQSLVSELHLVQKCSKLEQKLN